MIKTILSYGNFRSMKKGYRYKNRDWIIQAWEELTPEIIRNSFNKLNLIQ